MKQFYQQINKKILMRETLSVYRKPILPRRVNSIISMSFYFHRVSLLLLLTNVFPFHPLWCAMCVFYKIDALAKA